MRPPTAAAQFGEQVALLPHLLEAAVVAHGTGELVVQHERTGVDVAHRIDQAHDTASAARLSPDSASPSADRWKNESPVSTSG